MGIYDYLDTFIHNERPNTDVQSFAYVPAFALPEDFQLCGGQRGQKRRPAAPGVLPARAAARQNRNAAHRQQRRRRLPGGGESFQGAAGPLRESSLYNAAIFSAVLLATLGMAAFVYFFSRRREMYIARALGLPVSRAARQAASPLLAVSCIAGAAWT